MSDPEQLAEIASRIERLQERLRGGASDPDLGDVLDVLADLAALLRDREVTE